MFVFRAFFVGLLVFFMSEFGFADPTYGKVGGSAVLDPGKKFDSISSVTWKHRTDLALEWFGGEITCYRTFRGRCELNKTTGRFTITNLTPEDSGEYTPEINNSVLSKKELKLIKPVPKPTVTMDCNKEKTNCNLTCAANMMSEFGPVTYEWKTGETGETELSTNDELSLTQKNKESSFFCILRNPISNSTSDDFPNPIIRGNAVDTTVIVVVVLLLVAVIVIGAFFMNRAGHLPFLDNIFPCNTTARSKKRGAAPMEDGTAEAADNARQDVNVEIPLLSIENETNQDHVAETPNGELHEGNKILDNEAVEINSKGKEALNGYALANTNEHEEPNDPTCNPSGDQESNPNPSAVTPEPSSQTENNSNSEEALNGDQHDNANEDGISKVSETSDSMEQQQDPPAEQVSDDKGESGQNSRPEEPDPIADGLETSPPKSSSEETPDTVPADS